MMRKVFWCLLIIAFVLNADVAAQPELDTTFNSTGMLVVNGALGGAKDVVIQPDNKIVMVSACTTINGGYAFCAVRLNENGSPDSTFSGGSLPPAGFVVDNMGASVGQGAVRGLAIQSDGKLVLVGYANQDLAMLRLNTNGSLDTSFGAGGKVFTDVNPGFQDRAWKVVIQPDGKIVVVGYSWMSGSDSYQQFVARYTAVGVLDASFGVGGIARTLISGYDTAGASIVLQTDGKILAGGHMSTVPGSPSPSASYLLVRLNPDGSPDTTWDGDGILSIVLGSVAYPGSDHGVLSVAIQTDGRVVALGHTNIIYRFNTDGSLDLGFDGDGSRTALPVALSNETPYDLTLSAGGRITVVGHSSHGQSQDEQYAIARYRQDGSPDLTFSDDGYLDIDVGNGRDSAWTVAADSQGRIVVAGTKGQGLQPNPLIPGTFSAARLRAPVDPIIPGMLFDFDGDRRADIAVYRDGATPNAPSYWHILRSSDGVYQGIQLGANGDKPVPSDYNGDGKTEVAVWRPATGTWYTSTNPTINYGAFQWGQNGDVPLPGDFDGDRKADFVVYRPANGYWYVLKSSNGGLQLQQFGTSTDKPLLGDFDGDDKTDFAYYSPGATALAASFWNVIQSSNGAITTVQFGRGEDKAVPGDYDGDGLTNFAVFRPSTTIWYTSLNPAINYGAFQWGAAGDVPAPADYDGDAKTDFAIFRPGTTVWYILNSGNGAVTGQQWGIASDRPVPTSFIP